MHEMWEALNEGAPLSFVNVAVFLFVLAVICERTWYILTKFKVDANEFMKQIKKLVQAGNIDRAIKLCEAAPLPLLRVIKSGLTQVNRGEEAVINAMEETISEEVPNLEKRIGALWSLANIATLIGLLGTIRGLIKAFGAVKGLDPKAASEQLSAGISEAMWNTALGLGIAVVCMSAHLVLHGIAKKRKMEMERSTMQLENLLTLRRLGG
jgi:biopolymer transport protein ExbB